MIVGIHMCVFLIRSEILWVCIRLLEGLVANPAATHKDCYCVREENSIQNSCLGILIASRATETIFGCCVTRSSGCNGAVLFEPPILLEASFCSSAMSQRLLVDGPCGMQAAREGIHRPET